MTPIRAGGTPRLTLRRIAVAAVTLFVSANLVVGILRGDGGSRPAPASDAEIEAFLAEQIRDAGYPGAAFAIVRDGRVTHSGGVGRADASGRPVRPDTPFVIGSLSKAITATALMQLVQAGRVALDAPVSTYLPDFALAARGRRDHAPPSAAPDEWHPAARRHRAAWRAPSPPWSRRSTRFAR